MKKPNLPPSKFEHKIHVNTIKIYQSFYVIKIDGCMKWQGADCGVAADPILPEKQLPSKEDGCGRCWNFCEG